MAAVLENHELRSDEMNNIRKALGSTASPLIAVVARLFLAHPEGRSWQDTQCWGAVVLVMDRLRNARIIRMFDLQNYDVVFDEELYVGMNYVAARPYFHTFEVEGAVVGLDFCNHDDARTFHSRVLAMIPRPDQIPKNASAYTSDYGEKPKGGFFGQFKRIIGLKREASVSEIGAPTNVQHTQHIGFDPEKGFEIQNIPDEWKTLFKGAGIKPSHLKDRETAQAVFDTIRRTIATGTATKPTPPIAPANIPRPARAATVAVAPPPRAVIQPGLHQRHRVATGHTRVPSRSQPSAASADVDIGVPPPPPLPNAAPARHPPRAHRGAPMPSRAAAPQAPHPPAPKEAPTPAPIPQAPAVPPAPVAPSVVPAAPPVLSVPPPIAVPRSQSISSIDDSSRATLMSAIRNFSGDKLKVTPKSEDDSVQFPNLQEMDPGSKNSLMFQIKSVMDARRGVLAANADDDDDDDDDEWD